jgi:ATP-dependent exoDNAse (exonuclease V) beta subunit
MKNRVLSFLDQISADDKENANARSLIEEISKNLGISKEEVVERASIALELIMENFSQLSISTIDSFSHRVVRSFSKELNLHYDFDVSLDYKSWIELANDRLFDRFGSSTPEGKALSKTLINFFINQFEQGSNWNLKWILNDFAIRNFNDELHDVYEKHKELTSFDLEEVVIKLKAPINDYLFELKRIANKALDLLDNAGLTVDDLFQKGSGTYGFFKMASEGQKKFEGPNSYVLKALNENVWLKANSKSDLTTALAAIETELHGLLAQLIELKENSNEARVNELVLSQIHIMSLVSFIVKELDVIRKEENILLINDFNRLIDRVVKNEVVPFIYEKLGERYKHFLLDEFQDTSIKQWHNFVPLFDNAIASKNRNLIVGDGKQAIYRFRGGEVELFTELPKVYRSEGELFELYEKNLEREIDRKILENNFRSCKEIVHFNNDFFRNIKITLAEFSEIYDDLDQRHIIEKEGYVKVEILPAEQLKEEDLYLGKTLESIMECVNEGYDYGDIAVLARKRDNLKSIASYLSENGIDVVSDESLVLKNQEDINLLIALMKYLIQPDDLQNQYTLFRALIYKYERNSLKDLQLINGHTIPVKEKLDALNFKLNHEELRSLSLLELTKKLEDQFKLGLSLDAYYNTFLDVIEEYVRYNGNQLDGFLSYWDEIDPSISTPENNKAVKLLTIHKAKGLEYPVVIIPYLDWMKKLTQNYQWVDAPENLKSEMPKILIKLSGALTDTPMEKNYEWEKKKSLLDDINLIYVAFTRAMERLYVFTSDNARTDNISSEVLLALKGFEGMEESTILERGKREAKQLKEQAIGLQYFEMHPLTGTTINENLKIAYEFKKYRSEENKEALDYGMAVHELFSKINSREDIEEALNNSLDEGIIDRENMLVLRDKIQRILKLDPVSSWFSAEGEKYLERELVNADGKKLRPDRIVITENKVSVIDYKTGILNDKKMSEYRTQVKEYMEAFSSMNYKNVEGFIIAIDEEKVLSL